MSKPTFLSAEWRRLIMANYEADPAWLQPYLPAGTELDTWNGTHYVSLVGFLFQKVKVMGWPVPFHTRFPEVNLRFYVRYKENNNWKRGVVFISEIVPLPAIAWVANTIYKEHYLTRKMKYHWANKDHKLQIGYQWKNKGRWNNLSVTAVEKAEAIAAGSMEEFITEHYWGYSAMGPAKTGEYQVAHPRWEIYPVKSYTVDCDFEAQYGAVFAGLAGQTPSSVLLAEGSAIEVYRKKILNLQ
jgi:uncharacterized protein